MAVAFTACDDETNIDVVDGIPVADGFYITLAGEDPTTSTQLLAEKVEAADFGTQDREGFFANYVFLTAGNYNIVSIIDQKLSKTFGGTAVTETNDTAEKPNGTGSECDLHAYTLIEEFTEGGSAFSVSSAGLYKVAFDNLTKEILLHKIEKGELIGESTPAGWSSNANQAMALTGTASATGVKFEKTGIERRPGQYKVRFNCRWSIDRRIDPAAGGFEANKGYVTFTNFGGTFAALAPGGANFTIPNAGDGIYTITAEWTPENGFALSATKTQALEPIQFDPSEFAWAITGAATANGWANDDPADDPIGVDIDLNYEGKTGSTYSWKGTFPLTAGEFKFRTNNSWNYNRGFGQMTLTGPDAADLVDAGGNFKVNAAATYQFIITTSNEGDTWTLNVDKQ
jgi:Outer membrane protein SusF_SusE